MISGIDNVRIPCEAFSERRKREAGAAACPSASPMVIPPLSFPGREGGEGGLTAVGG